jgi:hypothetical protein
LFVVDASAALVDARQVVSLALSLEERKGDLSLGELSSGDVGMTKDVTVERRRMQMVAIIVFVEFVEVMVPPCVS